MLDTNKTTEIAGYKICSACGKSCYDNKFPQVKIIDNGHPICEECAENYELY